MTYAILLQDNKVVTEAPQSGLLSRVTYSGGKLPPNTLKFPSESSARDVAEYCSSVAGHLIGKDYKIIKLKEVFKMVHDYYEVDVVL